MVIMTILRSAQIAGSGLALLELYCLLQQVLLFVIIFNSKTKNETLHSKKNSERYFGMNVIDILFFNNFPLFSVVFHYVKEKWDNQKFTCLKYLPTKMNFPSKNIFNGKFLLDSFDRKVIFRKVYIYTQLHCTYYKPKQEIP